MTDKKTLNWPFYGWIAVIGAGIIIGIWGVVTLLIRGHGVTGATDQIPWGIFVPTYVFFVLMSSGLCMISSIGHVFGVKKYELIVKRAVFLAIVTMIAGGTLILLDLGRPLNAVYFLLSPNPTSPMWWMFALYIVYLTLMLAELYLLLTKADFKKLRVVGSFTLVCAIAAPSTLGAIFGFAFARPYFGEIFAPLYFILTAIVAAAALLAFVIIIEYRVTKKQMNPELKSFMTADLGTLLALVLGITIIFVIWKNLGGLTSPVETTVLAYQYMLSKWWYWVLVVGMGLLAPFVLLLKPGTGKLNGLLAASILVLIGMFTYRFEFVVGGQIVALVPGLQHLEWPFGSYTITSTDVTTAVFAFSLGALLYTLGTRVLNLGEVPHQPRTADVNTPQFDEQSTQCVEG